jgi:hypothetical protein
MSLKERDRHRAYLIGEILNRVRAAQPDGIIDESLLSDQLKVMALLIKIDFTHPTPYQTILTRDLNDLIASRIYIAVNEWAELHGDIEILVEDEEQPADGVSGEPPTSNPLWASW